MRRKRGSLIPIEVSILESALELRLRGGSEFHGFMLAKEMKQREDSHQLAAHGTLYRALERLEKSGLLESHWEDPALAALAQRPRRRLYRVTTAGEQALTVAQFQPVTGVTLRTSPAPR